MAVQEAISRHLGEYKNLGKEQGTFEVGKRTYAQQYSQIYYVRLAALQPILRAEATKKWSTSTVKFADRILDVLPDRLTCIIGTIYAEMEFKPNVLRELACDLQIVKQETKERYTEGKVDFFLEDDSARIALHFPPNLKATQLLVTGVSVALLGKENDKGAFEITDYCFAGLEESRPERSVSSKPEKSYVAFISGLSFDPTQAIKFDILSDLISGNLAGFEDLAPHIQRLILAGQSAAPPTRIDEQSKKKYGVEHAKYDFSNIKLLDQKLATLASSISIDMMPGDGDPTMATIPQPAMHKGMFPAASAHSSFTPVMNPHLFECNGARFLGTSGQNLDDLLRFSDIEDRLDIAEACLNWRNIAPTAPDTLWCFPFYDRDPFVLQQTPDVFFIGNQPSFQTRTVTRPDGSKILILLLPRFHDNPTLVLVNTEDLSCECIAIDV